MIATVCGKRDNCKNNLLNLLYFESSGYEEIHIKNILCEKKGKDTDHEAHGIAMTLSLYFRIMLSKDSLNISLLGFFTVSAL